MQQKSRTSPFLNGLKSCLLQFSRSRFLLRCAQCFWAIVFAVNSYAIPGQPGTLDASWATLSPLGAGKVITPVGSVGDFARALALQPDGKLVLAGYCSNGSNDDFCAIRYLPNGTLDTSFGTGGKVITPVGSGADFGNAIVWQPDGKLVLAGFCSNGSNEDFCAIRYLPNGTLDTSFGTGGKVITPVGSGSDFVNALVLQPDGKLVLVGACLSGTHFDMCALRYLPNGTLDASFGTGGAVITPVVSGFDSATGVAVQPDGKLVLAGFCNSAGVDKFCMLRYLPDGSLDGSFGTSGTVTTASSSSDQAWALALQPDGKLVLAGSCLLGSFATYFCAGRYLTNGVLDTGFGTGGTVITPVDSNFDEARALALQPNGMLVLAGVCPGSANSDFCAIRYQPNGTLDPSFGTDGKVITPVGSSFDFDFALALQPDGKLVLAGNCQGSTNFDFCAIRYDGGPFGFKACSLDIDGDNAVTTTIDSLIHARIALGITGPAVLGGITSFAPHATRTTWPAIREYLITQCGMPIP